jgi:anti-sigma-K factor RskA
MQYGAARNRGALWSATALWRSCIQADATAAKSAMSPTVIAWEGRTRPRQFGRSIMPALASMPATRHGWPRVEAFGEHSARMPKVGR